MDDQVKRHKTIARFVAFLGMLPGLWYLFANYTQLGSQLKIGCGYWIVMLIVLAIIWVMYAILNRFLMRDIGNAHDNANSLVEKRHYKMAYASTVIEAIFASAIFVLSIIGFFVNDARCFLTAIIR